MVVNLIRSLNYYNNIVLFVISLQDMQRLSKTHSNNISFTVW